MIRPHRSDPGDEVRPPPDLPAAAARRGGRSDWLLLGGSLLIFTGTLSDYIGREAAAILAYGISRPRAAWRSCLGMPRDDTTSMQDSSAAIVPEASQPAAPIDMPAGGELGDSLEEFAPQPAAEGDQVGGGETGGGLDILKPGSRWRLYRGNRAPDPEGIAAMLPPARGE